MRWKVTLQFLIAIIFIGIASNFINTVVMSYYFYVHSNGNVGGKMVVSFRSNTLDVKKAVDKIRIATDGLPVIDPTLVQQLDKSDSWVQLIDQDGKEIKSVNKPFDVKNVYSINQIASMQDNPEMVKGYNIFFFPNLGDRRIQKAQLFGELDGPLFIRDKRKSQPLLDYIEIDDGREVKEVTDSIKNGEIREAKEVTDNTMAGDARRPKKVQYIIVGVPKPKITPYTLLYSIYSYMTDWTDTENSPKLISTFFTLLLVLILGYIFARSLTKPVVKITEGIKIMAGGDYGIKYSEKGLYKDVYASLNHMTTELLENEIERRRIERMREDWISNISHDLKTPLSSIKGYGELLAEHDNELSAEERKKYFEIISNKSNYMEILLDDLKLTQKLKNELLPLKKVEGNLVEVLREVVINVLNDPKYESRKLEFKTSEESIIFNFDPLLMQRAITNIIYNAIMHNPEDTNISVRIFRGDTINIEIEDDGRGISEEDKKNLFERYYRGTNTDEATSGSGLGLAIAKQVIEAHDGKIELESEIGEGTKVRIKF